jgi:mRNA interferase HigB
MRIIARKALREFWQRPGNGAAERPLRVWEALAKQAAWRNPAQVKATFNSADILPGNRAVFDIGGNKFRMITRIDYRHGIVFIVCVLTHAQYDEVDAATVERGQC